MKLADAFVGRATELRSIIELMDSPRSGGVLVHGPTGTGKTRLATEVLRRIPQQDHHIAVVRASNASRRVPLGVFSALLESPAPEQRTSLTAPELVESCVAGVLRKAGSRHLVLMVDDAHLLDEMSFLIIERLSRSGRAFLVLTARTGEGEFETLTEMCAREPLGSVALSPLGRSDSYSLIEQVLTGDVDDRLVRQLFEHSEGNPLFLLELIRGSLENEHLVQVDGRWHLCGSLDASTRVRDVVASRIQGLDPHESELVELLAFVDTLTQQDVERISRIDALIRLEARGVIKTRLDHRRLFLSLAHSIYGDVLRSNMTGLRTQMVTAKLAEHFESKAVLSDDECLQLASLRLICGGGDARTMRRATRIALERHDPTLALECADATVELAGTADSHLMRARVLGSRGDFRGADSEIVDSLSSISEDAQLAEAAALRLDFLAFYQGHVEDALAFAADVENRIQDHRLTESLAARRAGALLHTDGPRAAAEAVEPLLARGGGEFESWACMLAGWALLRMGRIEESRAVTFRGDAVQSAHSYLSDWYPELHSVVRCYVDVEYGRFGAARELARNEMSRAADDHADEAYAGYALFLSSLARDSGHTDDALAAADSAVSSYRRLGRTVYLRDALVHRALALAIAGRGEEALRELNDLETAEELPEYWYFSPELHQARAWAYAAKGLRNEANTHFLESVRVSTASGDVLGALSAWHGAARIGFAAQAVEPMKRLLRQSDSVLAHVRCDHVHGLACGNAAVLQEVSERYDAAGADLLAGESAMHAASAYDRAGATRPAEAARRRATKYFRRQQGDVALLLRPRMAKALTTAEFDTANQAAQGKTNAEIAESLGLSVRTIENRLQRVYIKLGVNSRQALADSLDTMEFQH